MFCGLATVRLSGEKVRLFILVSFQGEASHYQS